jgi:hypothetical protein
LLITGVGCGALAALAGLPAFVAGLDVLAGLLEVLEPEVVGAEVLDPVDVGAAGGAATPPPVALACAFGSPTASATTAHASAVRTAYGRLDLLIELLGSSPPLVYNAPARTLARFSQRICPSALPLRRLSCL